MNVRLITGLIFVIIILGGLGVFFMNEQNTRELAQRVSPTQSTVGSEMVSSLPQSSLVSSFDGRITFRYPDTWYLDETTVKGGKGKFGEILQSWILSSNSPDRAGQGGIPQNTAKIDIEIQEGGANMPIEELVDCGMKTTSCEKIGIDNEQFIRSEQTLNTGMKHIAIATFYDNKILRMTALISQGEDQASMTEIINTIFSTINFSESSVNNR